MAPRKSRSKEVASNVWQKMFRPNKGEEVKDEDEDLAETEADEVSQDLQSGDVPSREFLRSFNPEAAEAQDPPTSFDGAGDFSYDFDPETEVYTITNAPQAYSHLIGVTVKPGSRAYDSIRSEHMTQVSLWEGDSPDVDPAAISTPPPASEPMESPTEYTPSGELGESPTGYVGEPGESELTVEDYSQIPGESNVAQPEGLEHQPYNVEDDPSFPQSSRLMRERAAAHALQQQRFQAAREQEEAATWEEGRAARSAEAGRAGATRVVEGE